jgi:hypothetical protein
MSEESGLLVIHQKYKLIWISVLSGMTGLVLVAFLLQYLNLIGTEAVVDPYLTDKIVLLIIFVLVFAIFFLKRSYLNISKIVAKAKVSDKKINGQLFSFLSESDEKQKLLAKAVTVTNSIMIVIWMLANAIVITAFFNFILVPYIKTFIIYSLIGIYLQIVNFPSLKLYTKINSFIND